MPNAASWLALIYLLFVVLLFVELTGDVIRVINLSIFESVEINEKRWEYNRNGKIFCLIVCITIEHERDHIDFQVFDGEI